MPATSPTYRIDVHRNRSRWPTRRPQRWTWTATNCGNNKVMARSSESYTNENDAENAAVALFGDGSRIWLSRPGGPDVIVREMVS